MNYQYEGEGQHEDFILQANGYIGKLRAGIGIERGALPLNLLYMLLGNIALFDGWYLQDTQAIESERQEFARFGMGMKHLPVNSGSIASRIEQIREQCLRTL